jgi:hypothetical protein
VGIVHEGGGTEDEVHVAEAQEEAPQAVLTDGWIYRNLGTTGLVDC